MECSIFFVKQKTAYEMRISDWSSDVCSSDLPGRGGWADYCLTSRLTRPGRQPIWRAVLNGQDRTIDMARPKFGEFVNQVRTEAGKIVWPKNRETVQTTIMVLIMTTLLALFFLGIDTVFNAIVTWLTSLAR